MDSEYYKGMYNSAGVSYYELTEKFCKTLG